MKKKNNKSSAKAKLAAGAEKIRKAQKEAKAEKVEPVVIPESTRPIEDIVRDNVTMLPGHTGIKLADNTPIEEVLRVQRWAMQLSDHVGFMIGDVILFGQAKWGREAYTAAQNQTGLAYHTLRHYVEASRKIAPKDRQASLSFSQHNEILRIGDEAKISATLKEVAKQVESGHAPTVKEIRYKVQKLTPRKVRKPKKATSGKGKKGKKTKPVAKPYEPTPDEQAKLDVAEGAVSEANNAIKEGGVKKVTFRLDNKEKNRWLKLLTPIRDFWYELERCTGYES